MAWIGDAVPAVADFSRTTLDLGAGATDADIIDAGFTLSTPNGPTTGILAETIKA